MLPARSLVKHQSNYLKSRQSFAQFVLRLKKKKHYLNFHISPERFFSCFPAPHCCQSQLPLVCRAPYVTTCNVQ